MGKEDKMEKYRNLGGNSAVAAYELAKDSVKIGFTTHAVYLYTNQSAGSGNIRKMKTLALAGKGLSTFIDTNVKKLFSRKVR
jgi:hypothetical protein